MKIGAMYSHLNGFEWIQYHQKSLWDEIISVIDGINAEDFRTKVSKEKTMKGKKLFSPIDLNKKFEAELESTGWAESRTSYWVTDDYDLITKTLHLPADDQKSLIEKEGKTAIRSYNQTDFMKY